MFIRKAEHAQDQPYFLFYTTNLLERIDPEDTNHPKYQRKPRNADDWKPGDRMGTGACVWGEGCWVLGPSLDASRCTAFIEELTVDGKEIPMISPPSTASVTHLFLKEKN